jgi:Ulp1 family protease
MRDNHASANSTISFEQLADHPFFKLYDELGEDKFQPIEAAKKLDKKVEKMQNDNEQICALAYGARRRTAEISKSELKALEPEVYLNDKVIVFQLQFVHNFVIDEALRP